MRQNNLKLKSDIHIEEQIQMIQTRFGEIDFDLSQQITLPHGIIGFEKNTHYVLGRLPQDEKQKYFLLQNLEDHDISFITLPVDLSSDLYERKDIDDSHHKLNIKTEQSLWLVIVNMVKNPIHNSIEIYANLSAPLIIDLKTRQGQQHIILNPKYQIKTKISK